jgi:mercuric ion transport protein
MDPHVSETSPRAEPHRKEHLGVPITGLGIGAAFVTLVAVLCCAGVPLILSFVGAIGLGVLVKEHLLFPLMIGSLLLGAWGAIRSYRTHQKKGILIGYLLSALAIPLGMKLYHPAMYGGLIALLVLTGNDLVQRFRRPPVCATGESSIKSGSDFGCP